jgi:hypothetical protein
VQSPTRKPANPSTRKVATIHAMDVDRGCLHGLQRSARAKGLMVAAVRSGPDSTGALAIEEQSQSFMSQ